VGAVIVVGRDELLGLHVDANAQDPLILLRWPIERIAVSCRGDAQTDDRPSRPVKQLPCNNHHCRASSESNGTAVLLHATISRSSSSRAISRT
jgi:hypothetical protein